jgi:hypothetical protein
MTDNNFKNYNDFVLGIFDLFPMRNGSYLIEEGHAQTMLLVAVSFLKGAGMEQEEILKACSEAFNSPLNLKPRRDLELVK